MRNNNRLEKGLGRMKGEGGGERDGGEERKKRAWRETRCSASELVELRLLVRIGLKNDEAS